jgi:hypothetical protein
MNKALLFAAILFVSSSAILSQSNDAIPFGNKEVYRYQNGTYQTKVLTVPQHQQQIMPDNPAHNGNYGNNIQGNSAIRWQFMDGVSIGNNCVISGNGLYPVAGWWLNNERISLYGNTNSTPSWEFATTNQPIYYNNVAISDTGTYIASGSYHNIYMFARTSSTPVFNVNLETAFPDTGVAGPTALTRSGRFMITSANRNDSSWILAYSVDSTKPVWKKRVGQTGNGGAAIQGVKISFNDSVAVVNTYGGFYVFRTYTGQLLYTGAVGGTQTSMAISGNGNYVGIINYSGFLVMYQWNGSTYTSAWSYPEGGSSWITAVDISTDGQYAACGTLNFLGGSNYDGRVRLFRISSGGTPISSWVGMGDEVASVSFSRNGNVLSACSWGDVNNQQNDLVVFKVSAGLSSPIFAINSPGSFFSCQTSDDGTFVFGTGKAVHARAFGNGGEAYTLFIDTNDAPLGIISNSQTPDKFELEQNYPNPFNPQTQIIYSLAENGQVSIVVYDVLGREVATLINKVQTKGKYSITFDGSDLPSGVYFYKMVTANNTFSKKMILAK